VSAPDFEAVRPLLVAWLALLVGEAGRSGRLIYGALRCRRCEDALEELRGARECFGTAGAKAPAEAPIPGGRNQNLPIWHGHMAWIFAWWAPGA
jgi:hypothetical protein